MQPEKNRVAGPSLPAAQTATAALGGMRHTLVRVAKLSACLLLLIACGDERAPWSGFDLFPGDAGTLELSPELESGLRAAGAAFLAQLAAGQGGSALDPNASTAGAGAARAPSTAAASASDGQAGNGANAGRQVDPSRGKSEGAMSKGASGHASASGPTQRAPASSAVDAGGAGASANEQDAGAVPAAPSRQIPAPDAGAMMAAGAAGNAGSPASNDPAPDAGAVMTAGAGGIAGSTPAGDQPRQRDQLDGGSPEPDADGGA